MKWYHFHIKLDSLQLPENPVDVCATEFLKTAIVGAQPLNNNTTKSSKGGPANMTFGEFWFVC